jgi:CRP-like cAMP-binding protein
MEIKLPDVSKQLYKSDILSVIESKYSTVGRLWTNHQMQWINGIYLSFKDHSKFLIILFLIKKTLDFYSNNFIKLSYEEFYAKDTVEIGKFNVIEISKALNIPRESTRRKIVELEKLGTIKRHKKKIIIDRSAFPFTRQLKSIQRIARFLSMLSTILEQENILLKKLTTKDLEIIIKDNFSYIWKLYYELQIPLLLNYKKIFKDLETFHIFGTCVVNQHLYASKISKFDMDTDDFFKSIYAADKIQGINAMSISDITGIPRGTVIRKLQKLVKQKKLTIDAKKHYKLRGDFTNQLKPLQKDILIKLANFSTKVYNLAIL